MSDTLFILRLQLFADGGGNGGGGAEGATGVSAGVPDLQSKGVKNPLANVQYGRQESQVANANIAPDERTARFEELIKGEYKDLYDARMSETIQKRLKSSKETVDKYNALAPTLEVLAKKYGIKDATDVEALNRAIEEDDSYYEEEAYDRGMSVEDLKAFKKLERENAEFKRQMEETSVKENADRIYGEWMRQSEELKNIYPSFNLEAEMANPRFIDLIRNNIDVKTAFEVLHKDEIIPAAMQYTARQVEQKLTNKILANGSRPLENGNSANSSVIYKSDVTKLSKADRQEIARRVARGERITF